MDSIWYDYELFWWSIVIWFGLVQSYCWYILTTELFCGIRKIKKNKKKNDVDVSMNEDQSITIYMI